MPFWNSSQEVRNLGIVEASLGLKPPLLPILHFTILHRRLVKITTQPWRCNTAPSVNHITSHISDSLASGTAWFPSFFTPTPAHNSNLQMQMLIFTACLLLLLLSSPEQIQSYYVCNKWVIKKFQNTWRHCLPICLQFTSGVRLETGPAGPHWSSGAEAGGNHKLQSALKLVFSVIWHFMSLWVTLLMRLLMKKCRRQLTFSHWNKARHVLHPNKSKKYGEITQKVAITATS